MNKSELRDHLCEHFNSSELNNLCFDLNIKFESIAGNTIEDKARELIDYCTRYGRINDLLNHCRELRPHVDWSIQEIVNQSSAQNRQPSSARIFISRIINPPREGKSLTTTWLTAEGDKTYIIDSIGIRHRGGGLYSSISGAVPPDAAYQFTYEFDSDELHALNPALRLVPTDQREVSFTLGLALSESKKIRSSGGRVTVKLYYHSQDGSRGFLVLEEPPQSATFISKLLGKVVKESSYGFAMLVSENGMQMGFDDETTNFLEYCPLIVSNIRGITRLPTDRPALLNLEEREPLNKAIIEQDKVAHIMKELSAGNITAFDLCAALMNAECEQALIEAASNKDLLQAALSALAKRHLIKPSSTLASFMLSNWEDLSPDSKKHHWWIDDALDALTFRPTGDWFSVLYKFAEHNGPERIHRLYLLREKLNKDQYRQVEQLCWDILKTSWPDDGAIRFLLGNAESPDMLESELLNLPISEPWERELQEIRELRKRFLREFGMPESLSAPTE